MTFQALMGRAKKLIISIVELRHPWRWPDGTGNRPTNHDATQCGADPRRRHGLLRYRLLRRRDPHAEPRSPGRRRRPALAVLQHSALQPESCIAADGAS